MGAIFCPVKRIKLDIQDNLLITSGNHEQKMVIPNFIMIAAYKEFKEGLYLKFIE